MPTLTTVPRPEFKLELGTYQLALTSVGFGSNRRLQLTSAKKGEEDITQKLMQAGIITENNYVNLEKLQQLLPGLSTQIKAAADTLRYYPPKSTISIEGILSQEKFSGTVKALTTHNIEVFNQGNVQEGIINISYFSDGFMAGKLPLEERTRRNISNYILLEFESYAVKSFGLKEDDPLIEKIGKILYDLRNSEKGGEFNCTLTSNILTLNGEKFNLDEEYTPKRVESPITKEEWQSVLRRHFGLEGFQNLLDALKDPEFRLAVDSITFQRTGLFGLGAIFTINLRTELGQEPIVIRTSVFNTEQFFKAVESIS
ncbi:hypothetical protein HY570_00505, partial [Candidatus Micrarchaeota archaeon]|nr:hypothetical protein [Candidatus Micrarchaeota archaeon]